MHLNSSKPAAAPSLARISRINFSYNFPLRLAPYTAQALQFVSARSATKGGAMADQQSSFCAPATLSLWARRFTQIAAAIAAVFVLYTQGATAFLNTQEAIKAKAVADNAAIRQKGEAVQAEQQARTQLEIARNAAERQSADADKAEAEAKKAEAETITKGQEAQNAELKTTSEARALKNEADIRRSKAITELEVARVAARQFKAEADIVEQKNQQYEINQTHFLKGYPWRCPGTFSFEKINARYEGRC
jgi:colicin import membrane protein